MYGIYGNMNPINIPPMLLYNTIYTIHGSYGLDIHGDIFNTFFWSEKTDVHPRYPDWNNQNSRWNSGCSSHIVGKSGTCVFLDPQIPPWRICFFEDKVSIFMGLSKTRVSPNAIVKYVIFLLAWPFIEITPPFSDTIFSESLVNSMNISIQIRHKKTHNIH